MNRKYDPFVRAWNRIADGGEVSSGGFDPRNNPDDRRRLIGMALLAAILLMAAMVLGGCTRRTYIPVERTTTVTEIIKDTIVDVRLETVRDTAIVESLGRDTTSYLADGTHYSHATWKGGRLGHSLGTLPGASVKAQVSTRTVIRRDSIPYTVEVERKLTLWERTKMEYGGFAMGAAAAFGLVAGILIFSRRKK